MHRYPAYCCFGTTQGSFPTWFGFCYSVFEISITQYVTYPQGQINKQYCINVIGAKIYLKAKAGDFIMSALHFSVTQFTNEIAKTELPLLVDFWAEWCGPCHRLAPIIDELADELDGKVIVGKVNVDEQNELAAQYGVLSIPTVVYIKDGKETGRLVGVRAKGEYLTLCGE